SVGFHPECCDRLPDNYMEILEKLVTLSDKIVAVGEVGLDYHYEGYDRALQIKLLCDQIELAQKHDLPLIFHCRDATADFLEILHKYKPKGVVHCFTGAPEVAKEIVELGLYVGFTGALTFKNAKKVKKSFDQVPLDRILLETDCPYMAPEPNRGKRCTSDMIEFTAACGAEIKNIAPQQLVDAANRNTRTLFNIK
ncbi:MAG: TatD family hydrolase, partial [Oscillospiraceae bacterium]